MAAAKKIDIVNFKLSRGIYIRGKAIHPTTQKVVGTGKDAKTETVQNIIAIPRLLANELANAAKGEIVTEKATINFAQEPDDDGLDALFDGDGNE